MRVQPIGIRRGLPRLEGAKAFADLAIFDAALHRKQGLRRVLTQRACECDLLLGGKARGIASGAPNFSTNCPASRSIIIVCPLPSLR